MNESERLLRSELERLGEDRGGLLRLTDDACDMLMDWIRYRLDGGTGTFVEWHIARLHAEVVT